MRKSNQLIRKGFRTLPVKAQPAPAPVARPSFRLSALPKAFFLWAKFKITVMILNWRNKPMDILIYPDPRLKRIAEPVDFEKTTLKERTTIVRKMGVSLGRTTYGQQLGIAAPQIGINLRVIIVRGNVMFNPEWQPTKAPPEQVIESCYSAPKKIYRVERAKYGWAKWTSIDGRPMEDKLTNLPSIVFQHELDHLNGKCCPDVGEKLEIKMEPNRTPLKK